MCSTGLSKWVHNDVAGNQCSHYDRGRYKHGVGGGGEEFCGFGLKLGVLV